MTPLQSSSPGWHVEPGRPVADASVALEGGGELRVVFLSPTLARITWEPAGGFREPHTWAITPLDADQRAPDLPWTGRPRASLAGFQRPAVAASQDAEGRPVLATDALAVTLHGGAGLPLRLVWREPSADGLSGRVYQSDRTTSAYLHERRTGLVRHCLERDPRDRYHGLGDKTGPLDLLANVATQAATRDAAQACYEKISPLATEIFQSVPLLRRVQALKPRDAVDRSYRADLLDAFQDNGATLPPAQASLETAFKRELQARHGVTFDRLLALADRTRAAFGHTSPGRRPTSR